MYKSCKININILVLKIFKLYNLGWVMSFVVFYYNHFQLLMLFLCLSVSILLGSHLWLYLCFFYNSFLPSCTQPLLCCLRLSSNSDREGLAVEFYHPFRISNVGCFFKHSWCLVLKSSDLSHEDPLCLFCFLSFAHLFFMVGLSGLEFPSPVISFPLLSLMWKSSFLLAFHAPVNLIYLALLESP